MKVLLFGATGMVGQGVLRECLLAADVEIVQSVGRHEIGQAHPKLRQITHRDLLDFRDIQAKLQPFDACFFCVGVSSAGMSEADYTRVTYGIALATAAALAPLNPQMTLIYVSAYGADSSEQGRVMWARVRGRTENALRRLPFKGVYFFRPGLIVPLHGIRSKTASYRLLYSLLKPLLPLARALWPNAVLTTESIGLAMLATARHGAPRAVLEPADIAALAR